MNRRSFLAASAGLAAVAARAQDAPLRAIDVQSHYCPPAQIELLERRERGPRLVREGDRRILLVGEWRRTLLPAHTDLAAKLRAMDAAGIERATLSINDPGPELFGDEGAVVARLLNDGIAEAVRSHPGRFVGLCTLPFQDMGAALRELDRSVESLGMRGVLLYSNLAGRFPDEPDFAPFWERVEAMKIPVLLHPANPTTFEATRGYEMTGGLGLMFDTTIALTRIILSGLLERHPGLKLVCPHVGGTLPYLIGRIDHQTQVLKRGAERIRRAPSSYLKQVWLDCVSPLPLQIRYGLDLVGPDRLLYASDHPWVDPLLIAANVRELPAEVHARVFRDNARKLFSL
jgi:predicted TIM-barrel fold metal-dependent hydrolase